MKRIISLLLAVITVVSITACNSTTEKNKGIFVKLVVNCKEVIENLENDTYAISDEKAEIIPENGVIYEAVSNCEDGKSAYDFLVECLQKEKIHYEGADGYIKAIGNIYEGDCGKYSGWMFYINGEIAEVGSSDYIVKENDEIEFKYVVDYMKLFE